MRRTQKSGSPSAVRKRRSAARKPAAKARTTRQELTQRANATRARILKTATSEFASKGYDGTRIDEIVRRCKISKNLLYYYFVSKERLFVEVLEVAYEAVQSRQAQVSVDDLDPISGMRTLIASVFQHFSDVPEFIGLLNSENLHKARHLRKSTRVRALKPPLVERIRTLLERGRKEGVFRSDADAVDIYIAISGMSYHALANRYTLSILFDRNFSTPEEARLRTQHITDVIIGYLRFKGG